MDTAIYQIIYSILGPRLVILLGINGAELASEIRRDHPDVPVMLAWGYNDVLTSEGMRAIDLLRKPYSVANLSPILRRAVQDAGASGREGAQQLHRAVGLLDHRHFREIRRDAEAVAVPGGEGVRDAELEQPARDGDAGLAAEVDVE